MQRNPPFLAALVLATLAVATAPAIAQEKFPAKTVMFVVPFPPGSPLDTFARVVAPRLNAAWDTPVIVENRAGASGTIGTAAVVRAAPDGHTLLFTIDLPITMAPGVLRAVAYEPAQDLVPVAMIGVTSNALFVTSGLGIGSVKALVDRARAQPGKLTYASAGNGSPAHFAGELFRDAAQVDIVHVPYKGSAQAVIDIVSGTVSMMFGPVGQALPLAKKGSVKILAVTGPRRAPLLPEVATLTELGYPGVSFTTWYGVFAPARTPASALARVERDLKAAVGAAEVRQKIGGLGIEPAWQGPAEFAATIQRDTARWARVAAAAKITAN